jgi:hypothetical protein
LPIGLGGVWNWRGTVGKTTGPNGDRRDVKGVIPDLDLVAWEGRRVIIAFDADADTNEKVELARALLVRELRMRGAEVASVTWDIAQGKGIDDLLATVGPEKVLELLEAVDFEKEESDDSVSVHQIAEAIAARHRFARDGGGRLYVYPNAHKRVMICTMVHGLIPSGFAPAYLQDSMVFANDTRPHFLPELGIVL